MFSLSSPPLALKGQLKLTTSILLVIIILFALYTTSCEARHLRVNGAKYSGNNKSSSPSEQDATPEVGGTAKKQLRASLMVRGTEKKNRVGSSTANRSMGAEAAASINPSGGIRNASRHNGESSRVSLRTRIQGIEVRSDTRVRSVLGVESNRDLQVEPRATTVYTAETLVAMDYPVAHPAPAVHNR